MQLKPTKVSSPVLKQLLAIFAVSICILLASSVASYYSLNQMIESSRWVNHTYQVLVEAENMISHVKDAETSQRGYLLTHNDKYLKPYTGAYERTIRSLNHLYDLTRDNEQQQQNLKKLQLLIEKKYARLQEVLDMDAAGKLATYENRAYLANGSGIMDDIRLLVNTIKISENKLLDERTETQKRFIGYTPVLIILAFVISLIITIVSYLRIKRDMEAQQQKQLEEEAKYKETTRRISVIEGITQQIAAGQYDVRSHDNEDDELGRIANALNSMVISLQHNFVQLERRNWVQTGSVKISDAIRGKLHLETLTENLVNTISAYLDAPVATFYTTGEDGSLKLQASYAAANAPLTIRKGEGILGQSIKSEKTILINNLPPGYSNMITSSTGSMAPSYVLAIPFIYGEEIMGALEICFVRKPSDEEIELLENNKETIAISINTVMTLKKVQELLEETQSQTEELQVQHNELENLNAELEAQTQKLQASEEELKVQQEELQQTNKELEQRSHLLEEKNIEVHKKAEELALSTRYKSEFLANISHELRTPLNSILLLSRLFTENNDKNLNEDQLEYARVIQSSGNGLLGLIDEILDLSKIEAGKMDLDYHSVSTSQILEDMHAMFKQLALEKNITFTVSAETGVPGMIETDRTKVDQVLRNLLSNALKFTAQGSVTLKITPTPDPGMICFAVKDTGIGIPLDKQSLVFEAFQQADGSTKRKFGGTGLGLSISRELVKLLGGEIRLTSKENEGSEFAVYLPVNKPEIAEKKDLDLVYEGTRQHAPSVTDEEFEQKVRSATDKYIATVIPENVEDDRNSVTANSKTILIIEDDVNFARSLLKYTRTQGYKGIVAVRGDEGMDLALKYLPAGILLDIQLPVKSGWEVMDQLKSNPKTRHIPVHIMSSYQVKNESLLKGAIDFINKPVAYESMKGIFEKIEFVLNRNSRQVLIMEDNTKHAKALSYFLETFNIDSKIKSSIPDSIKALKNKEADCVIIDVGLPDANAYQLLEEAKKTPGLENLPVIIFTGKSISMSEEMRIKQYADSIIVKTAHSYQRMLDEVSLFLHVVAENKPQKPEAAKADYSKKGALRDILNNKTVLVADDDVRNIFSLSKSLENLQMNVVTAINGKEALERLEQDPSIDIVLLDMMMPEMDGYETAKKIRENAAWKKLPVIAVTAKAMSGDRDKCINAGASDYISKPVDIDQLLSLLRVWLYETSH
jgi:signal transduction histidine kinase/CheY-like chemotaxis protein/CHASE3 domain sensor protein